MGTRFANITPDKSAYEKAGKGSTHDLNEAIAELVDNSLDARTDDQKDGKEILEVNIKLDKVQIEVSDNAKGMNEREAISSLRLFESRKGTDELGNFGMGMKAASLAIGNTLEIITGQDKSNEEYTLSFNVERWNNDKNLTWNHYPYRTNENKPLSRHGTQIIISDLRTNITPLKIEKLRKSLGSRYRSFIEHQQIIIKVDEIPCRSQKTEWREGYPKSFEIDCKYGKIYGIIGLMKQSRQIGTWGFDLFRNNRLIMQESKWVVSGHPSHAFIAGEIHLDFVPVNQDKNKFRTETKEYEEAFKVCQENTIFKDIASKSSQAGHPSGEHTKLNERISQTLDALATVFNREEWKEKIPKEAYAEIEIPTDSKVKVVIERRIHSGLYVDQENNEDVANAKGNIRIPKKTHKVFRWKMKNGKDFRIDHNWMDDPNQGRKVFQVDENKKILTIYTNQGFRAYLLTRDIYFYATEDIVDAIAQLESMENNLNVEQVYKYRDSLLNEVSKVLENKYPEIKARNYR